MEQDFLADEECKKASAKAMELLLQQDRTEKNLRDRLYRAGFSEKAADCALQYVMHFGYVDDLRYAANYISCHKDSKSRKELRYKLMERGVPQELIAEAFLEYEEADEYKALQRQMEKRLRGKRLTDLDYPQRDKIRAYFARKGYALTAIRSVMEEWMAKEGE